MTERLLISVVIIAAAILASWILPRLHLARRRSHALRLQAYKPGRPAILFFSGEGCASCHTIQRPALAEIEAEFGGRLQVIEIDALAQPDLADHWGVLSLPTTFIIDREGQPRRVNHSPARADRLRAQLAEIGEAVPSFSSGKAAHPSRRLLD